LVYGAPETPITFQDSGGTVDITLAGLATQGARISDRYDRGAGSKPRRYEWRFVCQWTNTPAQWGQVQLFLVESDGTYADGNYGTSDAAVSPLPNTVPFFGRTWVTNATANSNFVTSGVLQINDRYFSIIIYNAGSVAFRNTANINYFILTPIPEETQA
jgi:hypothetical protein